MVTNDWITSSKKPNPDFVYDESMNEVILEMYKSGSSTTRVAVKLGITRSQLNELRKNNSELNDICEFGENITQSVLEDIALRGAQGLIKNFNNTIVQFMLKSLYPDQYNDKKGSKDEDDTDSLLEKLTAGSLKLVRDEQ